MTTSEPIEPINWNTIIYRQRIKHDLSRLELANKVGVSSEYIRLLEAGDRQPSQRVANRLFKVFGIVDPGSDAKRQSRGRGNAERTREDIIKDLDKNMAVRDRITKRFWEKSEELADEWDTLMEELKNA